jgi:hypothetical protein
MKVRLVALVWVTLVGPWAAHAQPVVRATEELHPDRPEAWAVKYYASTTLLGGLDVPRSSRGRG